MLALTNRQTTLDSQTQCLPKHYLSDVNGTVVPESMSECTGVEMVEQNSTWYIYLKIANSRETCRLLSGEHCPFVMTLLRTSVSSKIA